jgi:hypothetical protein
MTPAEHRLLVEMFKQQRMVFVTLVETLKSQGIVQDGDLLAYDALVNENESHRDELEAQVEAEYQGFAKVLGVQTGLPDVKG